MAEKRSPAIAHVGFYVKDLAKSIAWYSDVLGMTPQFQVPKKLCALRFADSEDHDIFIHQAPENYEAPTPMIFDHKTLDATAGRVGFYHVCIDFGSFDAAMEAYGRAMEKGSAVGKAVEHGYGRGFYVRDPDGNLVELWSFMKDGNEDEIVPVLERYKNDEPVGGGYSLDAAETYRKWQAKQAEKVDA